MTQAGRTTTGADGRYWQALQQGGVELPVCEGCGRWHWPAVWRCGDCGSWDHAWRPVEMQGAIFTWTRTWHAFGGAEGIDTPFVSLVVALDGAPVRLTGLLAGDDAGLAIGAPVSGSVGETKVAGGAIPAIRWRLDSNSGK